jgi:hypothetical protein
MVVRPGHEGEDFGIKIEGGGTHHRLSKVLHGKLGKQREKRISSNIRMAILGGINPKSVSCFRICV